MKQKRIPLRVVLFINVLVCHQLHESVQIYMHWMDELADTGHPTVDTER